MQEVGAGADHYIERFYKPRRRHSTLGQVSPDQFARDVTPEFRHSLELE
jgi:hypothetical protein